MDNVLVKLSGRMYHLAPSVNTKRGSVPEGTLPRSDAEVAAVYNQVTRSAGRM